MRRVKLRLICYYVFLLTSAGYGAKLVETSDRPAGVTLVNPHRSTKTASPLDIMELAEVVQRGDEGVHSAACNKLSVIADQIKYLQEQARLVRDGGPLSLVVTFSEHINALLIITSVFLCDLCHC